MGGYKYKMGKYSVPVGTKTVGTPNLPAEKSLIGISGNQNGVNEMSTYDEILKPIKIDDMGVKIGERAIKEYIARQKEEQG